MKHTVTLIAALIVALSVPALAASLELTNDPATGGPGRFAVEEIRREAELRGMTLDDDAKATRIALTVGKDGKAAAQSYRIRVRNDGGRRTITVRGADEAGAMYGGLDIAEAIRTGRLDSLKDSEHSPHIAQRGIKFNIPLDLRTPSYTDCSDAAQANIPEMWERDFWTAFLDAMARHRYNVLSLWSLHPFPSLVKVPEFPEPRNGPGPRPASGTAPQHSGNGTSSRTPSSARCSHPADGTHPTCPPPDRNWSAGSARPDCRRDRSVGRNCETSPRPAVSDRPGRTVRPSARSRA